MLADVPTDLVVKDSLAVLTRGPRTQRLQPNHVIFVSRVLRINYTQETAEPLGAPHRQRRWICYRLIVYAYIGLLPMGIGEAQWPLPDEGEGDHPSIKCGGIKTRKAINACIVCLGKETEKETTFANREDRDKETEVLGVLS